MTQTNIEELKIAFEPIANKIGQGAEFGWETVMRQQIIDGVGYLIGFIVALFIFIILFFYLKKTREKIKKDEKKDYFSQSEELKIVYIQCLICNFIVLVLMFIFLFEALSRLINPSYYALNFFIEIVK